jgi:hypothetical protein
LTFFLESATGNQQLKQEVPEFLFGKFLVEGLPFGDFLVQSIREHVKDELDKKNNYMNFLLTSAKILVLGLLDFWEEKGLTGRLLADGFEFVGPFDVVFGVVTVEKDFFVRSDGALFKFGVLEADASFSLSVAHRLVEV